jgi:Ca2+-binding EF-hand superfamily protein
MIGAALVVLALAAALAWPASTATESDAPRDLVFLAENRPIFVRLRITFQGRPFEQAWIDSVKSIHATLDRNGDGKLATKEVDSKLLAVLVRLATGVAAPSIPAELDVQPKDGIVSVDELAEAIRPVFSPFRLPVGRQAIGRTDALFDQLDRDKDGQLTRGELAAIAGSLRPLDLDDDETISAYEIEPLDSAGAASMMEGSSDRPARLASLPPVVELVASESSFRAARLLLKKYDKPSGSPPGRMDNKLSPDEFAIDHNAFAAADKNGDDLLDTDELRKLLARPPFDLTLDVDFPAAASARAAVKVAAGGDQSKQTQVRRLADGDVEFALTHTRLDIHIEDGNSSADEARRIVEQRFKAADTNKDGYLEGKELAKIDNPQSSLAGLTAVIDRNGDGKIYLKELVEFITRQAKAVRACLVVTTADQGRAIFGIVDLDRDRRLGPREVMRTVDRVMSWDGDADGRVSADEIPYHMQVTIARSGLIGLIGEGVVRTGYATRSNGPTAGPEWFLKMDRNHDGDVSRREFLGPRAEFDRLDRDQDGLIDAAEAGVAAPGKTKAAPAPATGRP